MADYRYGYTMPFNTTYISDVKELALTGAMVAPLSLPFLTNNIAKNPDSVLVAVVAGTSGTVTMLAAHAIGVSLAHLLRVPVQLDKPMNRGGFVVALLCWGGMAAGSNCGARAAIHALPASPLMSVTPSTPAP